MKKTIAILLAALCALILPACSGDGYQLQGRVIRGDYSAVLVVDASDSRLDSETGISGVDIHVQQDPGKLNRRTLARNNSAGDGSFTLPIDLLGAGSFNYDIGVFARKQGYDPSTGFFRLPSKSKRVLIVMNFGRDQDLGEEPEDLYGQYEQFRDSP